VVYARRTTISRSLAKAGENDHSPKGLHSGYGEGSEKAVVAFYMLQRGSNINAGNFLQNVTIQTGKGIPARLD